MTQQIDFKKFVPKFDSILARGLSSGMGSRNGQMCIEAAVCAALDLPHGDDPQCVASAVRTFKIALNDSNWSSTEARAKGLRSLGIAQVGSKGVVDDVKFVQRLSELTIRKLLPTLLRDLFPKDLAILEAAKKCEMEGTADAAEYAGYAAGYAARSAAAGSAAAGYAARSAAEYAGYAAGYAARSAAEYAGYAAGYAARSAAAGSAAAGSAAAGYAARSAAGDKYLTMSADLALQVLTELKSPGVAFIHTQE